MYVGSEFADAGLTAHGGHDALPDHKSPDIATLRFLHELLYEDVYPETPEGLQHLLNGLLGLRQNNSDTLRAAHQFENSGRAADDLQCPMNLRGPTHQSGSRDIDVHPGQGIVHVLTPEVNAQVGMWDPRGEPRLEGTPGRVMYRRRYMGERPVRGW